MGCTEGLEFQTASEQPLAVFLVRISARPRCTYMSCSLNSFKAVLKWILQGTTIEVMRGATRSLNFSLHEQAANTLNSRLGGLS